MNFLFENISPKQIVLKNAFWLILGQGILWLSKLFLFIFIARILGPEALGAFQYLLAVASFFFIFSDFGISYLIVRDYNKQKEEFEKLVNTGSFLREFLIILSLTVALTASLIFKNIFFRQVFIVLSLFLALNSFKDYLTSFYRAYQKMEKEFLLHLIESVLAIFLSIGAILIFKNILALSFGYLIGIIFSILFGIYLLKSSFVYLIPKFNLKNIKYYLKNGAPLALFGILNLIFFNTDQVLLGKLKGAEVVGYYSVASKIVSVLIAITGFFITALAPQIFENVKNQLKLIKILKYSSLLILFINAWLMIGVLVLAPWIVFIFGENYWSSIQPLRLLSLLILLFPLTTFFDNLLFALNKQLQDFLLTSFSAILNIVLNFFLIPKYSIFGSIYATLITQTINLVLTISISVYYLKKAQEQLLL